MCVYQCLVHLVPLALTTHSKTENQQTENVFSLSLSRSLSLCLSFNSYLMHTYIVHMDECTCMCENGTQTMRAKESVRREEKEEDNDEEKVK